MKKYELDHVQKSTKRNLILRALKLDPFDATIPIFHLKCPLVQSWRLQALYLCGSNPL